MPLLNQSHILPVMMMITTDLPSNNVTGNSFTQCPAYCFLWLHVIQKGRSFKELQLVFHMPCH